MDSGKGLSRFATKYNIQKKQGILYFSKISPQGIPSLSTFHFQLSIKQQFILLPTKNQSLPRICGRLTVSGFAGELLPAFGTGDGDFSLVTGDPHRLMTPGTFKKSVFAVL